MKRLALLSVVAVLVVLVVAGLFVYQDLNAPAVLEPVKVGNVSVESFALLYVAQNQSFFANNGLNVSINDYSTGANAVNALNSGDIEVGGSSEYVVALDAVERQNISIIACCADSEFVDLIARNDHGIFNASDLNGKTIGVAHGTVTEFNLGEFLTLNGLSTQNITTVNLAPAEFASAIVNGSVDAVVSWEPYTEQVKAQLGTGFVDWSLQTNAPFYSVLSCRNNWLANHKETVTRLLRSLDQAQNYITSHPVEAKQIIKNRFNFTDNYMSTVWSRNHFELTLTSTLIQAMQDEATWMIKNNLTTQQTAPNIINYVDTTSLREIKFDAVTIP